MLDVSIKCNFTSLCKMRHTGVGPAIIKLFVSCKGSVRLVIGMTAVQCKAPIFSPCGWDVRRSMPGRSRRFFLMRVASRLEDGLSSISEATRSRQLFTPGRTISKISDGAPLRFAQRRLCTFGDATCGTKISDLNVAGACGERCTP